MSVNTIEKESEVYSITGFKDVLASPGFYPVLVVTLVLGISSIFGFLQNPLKLKNAVNVIHQKVSQSGSVRNKISTDDLYVIPRTTLKTDISADYNFQYIKNSLIDNAIKLNFAKTNSSYFDDAELDNDIKDVTFNYDITSKEFWNELDSSTLETALEESEKEELENIMHGIPLESDYKFESDSIYSLNTNPVISL